MSRHLVLALAVVGILGVAGTGLAQRAAPLTVRLSPQNNSGESGTAMLTEDGSKTKVVLAINGAPPGVGQPVHIHKGSCAALDANPAYGLTTLTDGKSETTVDVPLATLQAGGYAINGHKSAEDVKTYVFCGNIENR
jgi:hypothetical protein